MEIDLSKETNSNGFVSVNSINKLLVTGYKDYIDSQFLKLEKDLKEYIDLQIKSKDESKINQYIKNELELKEQILKLKQELFTIKTENMNKDIRSTYSNLRNKIPFSFRSNSYL